MRKYSGRTRLKMSRKGQLKKNVPTKKRKSQNSLFFILGIYHDPFHNSNAQTLLLLRAGAEI